MRNSQGNGDDLAAMDEMVQDDVVTVASAYTRVNLYKRSQNSQLFFLSASTQ